MHPAPLCFIVAVGLALGAVGQEDRVTRSRDGSVRMEEVRSMVEKALPFLREEADAWIADRGCVSCHQVPFGIWTHVEAARKGFQVDGAKLEEWADWSTDWRYWMQPDAEATEAEAVKGNVDTMAQLVLALATSEDESGASRDWVDGFRTDLVGLQEEAGGWRACGQLPLGRRPARETKEVSTMWVRLALQGHADAAAVTGARKKSDAWLETAEPGQSTEWWALRLLEAGSEDRFEAARKELLAKQRPVGGWGWLTSEAANALGTGQAMYALGETGASWKDPALQRALAFLQETQKENGSWAVPSTRKKDGLKVKKTSIYFGTAWAVLGILAALPEVE